MKPSSKPRMTRAQARAWQRRWLTGLMALAKDMGWSSALRAEKEKEYAVWQRLRMLHGLRMASVEA